MQPTFWVSPTLFITHTAGTGADHTSRIWRLVRTSEPFSRSFFNQTTVATDPSIVDLLHHLSRVTEEAHGFKPASADPGLAKLLDALKGAL